MNKEELYQEMLSLAPYKEATEDYRKSLKKAFSKMEKAMDSLDVEERPENWINLKSSGLAVMEKLKSIAKNAYKGLPSTAYNILSI